MILQDLRREVFFTAVRATALERERLTRLLEYESYLQGSWYSLLLVQFTIYHKMKKSEFSLTVEINRT